MPSRVWMWVAVIAGVLLSGTLSFWLHRSHQESVARRLDESAAEVESAVAETLRSYEASLQGLRGLFESSEEVTPEEFERFVDAMLLDDLTAAVRRASYLERSGNTVELVFTEPPPSSSMPRVIDLEEASEVGDALAAAQNQARLAHLGPAPDGSEDAFGLYLAVRQGEQQGWVGASVSTEAAVQDGFSRLSMPVGIEYLDDDGGDPTLLWPSNGAELAAGPDRRIELNALGLPLTLRVVPLAGSSSLIAAWSWLAALAYGLLVTILGALVVRTISLRRDVRRGREIAESLRAVDQTKSAFLVAVSHELRTPLTSVLGYAEVLRTNGHRLDAERTRDISERLAHNAHRLDRLLGDLLDIDRMSRGVLEARRFKTDVGKLVLRVLEEVPMNGHPVEADVTDVTANVDPAHVERIVENLLVNARKHTPDGTPVRVMAARADKGVVIGVDDRGPGIPAEIRQTVFEPFVQGDIPEHAPGTGVGLTVVARLAELHGGRAWVTERPGGGAAFRVFLPDGSTTPEGAEITGRRADIDASVTDHASA